MKYKYKSTVAQAAAAHSIPPFHFLNSSCIWMAIMMVYTGCVNFNIYCNAALFDLSTDFN